MSAPPNSNTASNPSDDREDKNQFPEKPELPKCITRWFRGFHLHREKPKITDLLMVGLTLAVAIAAFLSAWSFRKQLTDSSEAFMVDERAWVGPKTMILKEMHAPDPINADITIENFGKTPALKMKVRYYLYVSDTTIDIEKTSDQILAMPSGETTISALFPSDTNHLIAPTSATDELGIQSVKSGRKLLYFFAWIWYEDVFHMPHKTRFCAQFRPNGQVLSACDGQYDQAD